MLTPSYWEIPRKGLGWNEELMWKIIHFVEAELVVVYAYCPPPPAPVHFQEGALFQKQSVTHNPYEAGGGRVRINVRDKIVQSNENLS